MLGALVIVFREVLEAGLIIGIVLAATSGAPGRGNWVAAGVLAGQALGAVAFGVGAAVVCFMVVGKLDARRTSSSRDEIPVTAPPTPPFSSGKAATAIDWTDSHNDVKRP